MRAEELMAINSQEHQWELKTSGTQEEALGALLN